MQHNGTMNRRARVTTVRRIGLLATVILLGGCGDDSNNDVSQSTDPSDGGNDADTESDNTMLPPCLSDPDPSLEEADADDLFYADTVPTFDLYLPEDEWTALQEDAVLETYTEVEACYNGRHIGTVGLRFKGSYGTLYGCFEDGELICDRLSMKLKFNKYVEDQRFFGMKRLNFHANRHDESRMKERLAYDLYRSMGITAPRASWAVVRVNGESYGLYGMVEQIDGRFTDDRWPDYPDNNLYKELWPTDTRRGTAVYHLRTNEEASDVSSFIAFSQAFMEAEEADRLSTLGEYTDLDHWARYMAVDEAVLSYDGVTYFWTNGSTGHNHNYFIYEDAPGHFTLIPWDVEATFWINPNHAPPHWTETPDDCDATYPYWSGLAWAPGCDPVFKALATDLSGFKAAARELLDGPFALDTMLDTIDAHVELIGEEARAPETPGSFDSGVAGLKSVIPRLRERLEGLISEE